MVQVSLRMRIPHTKWGEVAEFLTDFARRTRYEPGCLESRVYQDVEQKRGVLLEELWKDPDQLERHLRSSEFQKLILVMELSVTPPEVSFRTVTRSTGIETIEEARRVAREDS